MGYILWGLVIIQALLLEWIGRKPDDKWPTLTDIIRRWVPKTLILTAILWLGRHFHVEQLI